MIADGALFGVMAVGAVLRRAGVINNVVPKTPSASRRRGVENVVDVDADAEAEDNSRTSSSAFARARRVWRR